MKQQIYHISISKPVGVNCLKFNIRNCGDVVNVFLQIIKKGAFTNSEDPDDTRQNAASHLGLRYLPFQACSC